jgi:hypothetical protein
MPVLAWLAARYQKTCTKNKKEITCPLGQSQTPPATGEFLPQTDYPSYRRQL